MNNFPRKRHWVLIMILWVPAQVRNFGNPALGWIGLLIAAVVGLVIAYFMVYALTAIVDKLWEFGRRMRSGDA